VVVSEEPAPEEASAYERDGGDGNDNPIPIHEDFLRSV
jgi:hypothetical protein